jgi:preprotein translocase subunit SecY
VVALIYFFCYFWTAITFNPKDMANNLKDYGSFIPGYRPGKRTAEHIDQILARVTLAGAVYVTAVCLLPEFLILRWNVPFYFGGTSLLIVVGVAMDTVQQVESQLIMRHYDGFMKKTRIRGRRG